uniref:lactadherin n=1 Tax=Panthera onca TaxID=9690 RepID=UPI00295455FB|nr:lactadherin [Panthera onca]
MPGPRLLAALCGALLCASGLLAFSGDFCDSSQCLNGGTCLLGRDNTPFYCLCPEGFTGIICNETEKGPCNPNPCYNDAECQVIKDEHRGDIFTQYFCKCPHGYTGVHCEISEYLGGECSYGERGGGDPEQLRPRAGLTPCIRASSGRWGLTEPQNRMTDMSAGWRCQVLRFLTTVAGLSLLDNSCTVGVTEAVLSPKEGRVPPNPLPAGCAEPLGMKDNTIPDRQITASSIYRTWGLNAFSWYPFYARLDKQGKFNAWTAQTNDASEWLQVDLGTQRQVTGIITQGARDFGHIQYVAAYKVAYSNNSMNWTEYRDQGALDSKIFPGNLDNNSHKKNMFEMPFLARFVRVLPVAWHNRITLRVELLGC